MTTLSPTQLRLYRAVLARHYPAHEIERDAVAVSGQLSATYDRQSITISWRVLFDTTINHWTYTVSGSIVIPAKTWQEPLLCDLAVYLQGELDSLMDWLDWREENESIEERKAAEKVWHEEQIAQLKARVTDLSDDDLLTAHAEARRHDASAWDDVSRWDWDPAYTGPDDPGKAYYKTEARRCSETLAVYEAEMKRRGLKETQPLAWAA